MKKLIVFLSILAFLSIPANGYAWQVPWGGEVSGSTGEFKSAVTTPMLKTEQISGTTATITSGVSAEILILKSGCSIAIIGGEVFAFDAAGESTNLTP